MPKAAFPAASFILMRFRSLSDPDSLREFAKNLREGIYISTRDGRLLDCNVAFLRLAGVSCITELGEFGAANLFVDINQRVEWMRLLDRDGSVHEFEIVLRRADGETRTVVDTSYLIRDPDTGDELVHGILFDITVRKALEASLYDASRRDALTGVLNRRHLTLVEEKFDVDPSLECGAIFVDVDNFKCYNDQWGHHEGDEVLRRMAFFLARQVRGEESVVRLGGDEFVILLEGADEEHTRQVAERLRVEALDRAPVPFSLGHASRHHGESVQRLLDRADQALMAVRVVRRRTDPRQRIVIA
jgi:diguanylate cyclase (GGDEF)-like protein/PAS domain S-box-containing protein